MKPLEPDRLILIGASTGGPAQIEKILLSLPKEPSCTLLIGQHMGDGYIPSFIKRLDEKCAVSVRALEAGMSLRQGVVYIASGKAHLREHNGAIVVERVEKVRDHYNPDLDHLFSQMVPFGTRIDLLAVILTGIGADGVEGCAGLAQQGVRCVAESQESAIVYGMPMRAKERIATIEIQSLDEIIETIRIFGASHVRMV